LWSAGSVLADHQRDAVARAIEIISRCGGVLLADEPGLGKSFIAAEVARQAERSGAMVEVIVPASLAGQWNETLRRFGVNASIVTHDAIIHDTRVPEPRRRLIVVDEAHAFRNPRTQRYDALARRSVGAQLLLVTATPLCNSARDLRALIDMIAADDVLAERGVPSIDAAFELDDRDAIARVVAELLIRRDRMVLPVELQFGTLDARVIPYDVFDGDGEVERVIESLQFPLIGETAILRQFLWRRLESSESALLESIRRQHRFYERAIECLASGRALPKREYRRAFAHEEDADAIQQVLFWEMFIDSGNTVNAQEIDAEILRLDELQACVASSPRQKLQSLLHELGDEPAVLFTGWAATAMDLYDAVRMSRRAVLATGRDRRRAAEAIEGFRAGDADVLVATDLAAEGLNLQRAGTIVHYDLPWNPVKIDQRNGRALRIGQKRESVRAIYFLPNGDRSRVIEIVARKNETRRRLLECGGHAAALGDEERQHGRRTPGATLRPRVTRDAAIVRFGPDRLPGLACRRHKAGIERLLTTMAGEYIDDRKLSDLRDLLAFEPAPL
jgi:superfamily II DNA or RNA helicase